jgi:hypothetical protein
MGTQHLPAYAALYCRLTETNPITHAIAGLFTNLVMGIEVSQGVCTCGDAYVELEGPASRDQVRSVLEAHIREKQSNAS